MFEAMKGAEVTVRDASKLNTLLGHDLMRKAWMLRTGLLLGDLRVSHQAAIHFSVFVLGNDLLLIFIGFIKWYILRHIIYRGFKYPAKDEINCWAV